MEEELAPSLWRLRLSEPYSGCETKDLRQKVSGLGWFCCPPGYGNGFYTNAKVIYISNQENNV